MSRLITVAEATEIAKLLGEEFPSPQQTRQLVRQLAQRRVNPDLEDDIAAVVVERAALGPKHLRAVVSVGGDAPEESGENDIFLHFDTDTLLAVVAQLLKLPGFDGWVVSRLLACPGIGFASPEVPQLLADAGWLEPAARMLLDNQSLSWRRVLHGREFADLVVEVTEVLNEKIPPGQRVLYAQLCFSLAPTWDNGDAQLAATAAGILTP